MCIHKHIKLMGIGSVESLAFLIVMHIVNEQQYIHGRESYQESLC